MDEQQRDVRVDVVATAIGYASARSTLRVS